MRRFTSPWKRWLHTLPDAGPMTVPFQAPNIYHLYGPKRSKKPPVEPLSPQFDAVDYKATFSSGAALLLSAALLAWMAFRAGL